MRNLILLFAGLLLAGCATRTHRFDGIGADGTPGREVRYILESEDGREGLITLRMSGKAHDRIDGRETDVVRLTVVVDNYAHDGPVELPLEGAKLMDDQGREWQSLSVIRPPGSTGDVASVAGSRRESFTFVYDAGAAGALRPTGSLTFDWSYRVRGAVVEHATRFLPVRIERQTVYWSGGFIIGGGYWNAP